MDKRNVFMGKRAAITKEELAASGFSLNERVRASLANHTPRLTLTAAIRFGYVNKLQTFNAGNVFAVIYPAGDAPDSRYVVYSYGWHWPMYIKQGVQWYGNADKYSVTTSKHASQFAPNQTQETPTLNPMTCAQMLDIAEHGIAGMVLGKPVEAQVKFNLPLFGLE